MRKNSFIYLNLTQFFSALNDNIYKLLLIFQLIALQGISESNTILSFAGAIFVLPFLFFASLAGSLADRFSKRSLIVITRVTELFVVSLGVLAFFLENSTLGYFVLFLMATQSALFSPAKYGIIPEIVAKEDISRFNGIMTATTYLAIIMGTFFASFLADITKRNFVFASMFCMIIAIFGALTSWGIEKTSPQAKNKKLSFRFFTDIYKTLKKAKKTRHLLFTIIFGSYFLFLGAYIQLNIIPFATQSLGLTEIQGGYLFLMSAIGIGIGSFFAGRLSGKEVELGIVPLAGFMLVLLLFGIYLFASHFFIICSLLILLGMFGGFYIVPIDAFIQAASPNEDRGENVAASNFLNFLGVVIASFFLFLFGNVFKLSAAEGFLLISLLTFFLTLSLFFVMRDQVIRFLLAKVFSPFWKLDIQENINLRHTSPILLIGARTSWLDSVIVMAALPRLIRYVAPVEESFLNNKSFLQRLWQSFMKKDLITNAEEIAQELDLHHSLCLMYPHSQSQKWEEMLYKLALEKKVVLVKITIEREASHFKALFSTPARLTFSPL